VGDPVSIIEAVALGVDMFDCVLPTRLARHGTALTWEGRMQARAARFATDQVPIDPQCSCRVCSRYSRGYVRHLLAVDEPAGGRLLTLHNLSWMMGLFERIRESVRSGSFAQLGESVGARWKRGVLR